MPVDGVSAVSRCECRTRRYRAAAFARVPALFNQPRLATIAARPSLHTKQAGVIEMLKANPSGSYFFHGRNGAGKTHLAWALYCEAVDRDRYVVACKLDELLVEYRRFELMRQDDPENRWRPTILSDDLKRSDKRWFIFIDELEKSTPTEFAAKRFFALVDAIQEYGHQFVGTSNLAPKKLQERWSRDDDVWGNSIARRIAQTCALVDLS